MQYDWSDKQGNRDRQAWLLLVRAGRIVRFDGASIESVCAVVGKDYCKNGKWSHYCYRMELAAGTVAVSFKDGWEQGTLLEGLSTNDLRVDRWSDLANRLGVSVPEARRFLEAEAAVDGCFGRRAARAIKALDAVDEALGAIDDASDDGAAELSISFGGATRRQIAAGFFEWPVRVVGADGAVLDTLRPEGGSYASATGAARVIACEKSGGHGGGYVSLRVAAPTGASLVHGSESEES